jgi:hypothetical protein
MKDDYRLNSASPAQRISFLAAFQGPPSVSGAATFIPSVHVQSKSLSEEVVDAVFRVLSGQDEVLGFGWFGTSPDHKDYGGGVELPVLHMAESDPCLPI